MDQLEHLIGKRVQNQNGKQGVIRKTNGRGCWCQWDEEKYIDAAACFFDGSPSIRLIHDGFTRPLATVAELIAETISEEDMKLDAKEFVLSRFPKAKIFHTPEWPNYQVAIDNVYGNRFVDYYQTEEEAWERTARSIMRHHRKEKDNDN